MGSVGISEIVVPILSKAHERSGETGDESREGVQGWFEEGGSFDYFH